MANQATGASSWGFMATGPTQFVALGATSVTVTLSQFVSTAPYAKQVAFYNQGAANANSTAFVSFGSSTVTASITAGVPIVAEGLMGNDGPSGGSKKAIQILTTGKSAEQYLAIGSAGTTTVWITPGEGSFT